MPVRPSTAKDSPNAALRDVLLKFFADGPHLAALRYRICTNAIKIPLQAIVRGGPLQAPPSLPKEADLHAIVSAQVHDHLFVQTLVDQLPWDDSKRAAEFVTLLCSDLEDLDSRVRAAAFNSRKLGGMPSMTQVRREPSADLSAALSKAIAVQRAGDAGRAVSGGLTVPSSSTCLVVLLVDTAALRSAELRPWSAPTGSTSIVTHTSSSAATAGTGAGAGVGAAAAAAGGGGGGSSTMSYTHRFVLLVDGSGVGLYQAWGPADGSGGSSSSYNCNPSSGRSSSTSISSNGGSAGVDSSSSYTLHDWLQSRQQQQQQQQQRASSPTAAPSAVMSYEEAAAFARTLHEFCERLTWDETANRLYRQLFGVDLAARVAAQAEKEGAGGGGGGVISLPGRIRSWVRILEVPYVTAARIRTNARLFM